MLAGFIFLFKKIIFNDPMKRRKKNHNSHSLIKYHIELKLQIIIKYIQCN